MLFHKLRNWNMNTATKRSISCIYCTAITYISPTYTHTVQYIYIYIYIYLFVKSLLHVSAYTAPSSGRTLLTSTATSSSYQYRWYRQALGNKFKTHSWKTNIWKAIIYSGNNEAKREACRECGYTWHACWTWDAYPRAHFQWKTLYKQGSKSKPLRSYRLSSVHEKCQRCKPGRPRSSQMKGMHAVIHSVHGILGWGCTRKGCRQRHRNTMKQATDSKTHQSLCDRGSHNQCARDYIGTCEVSPLGRQCLFALRASGTD